MACNENIVKNMANEVTRICQGQGIIVEPEFVMYMIDLLLLNPKYGKLFTKTLNRNCLAYFVNEVVERIARGGTPINTMKMQFVMTTQYALLDELIDRYQTTIDECYSSLQNEILDEEPKSEEQLKKMYRKIAIYIVLASGLGHPGSAMNLKEGFAALESVFKIEELPGLMSLSGLERMEKLNELMELVGGVRLFNRDCKLGGETIPDLPFDLVESANACLSALSNCLISVMQRVNTLTTAIDDSVGYNEETRKIYVDPPARTGLSLEVYQKIMDLLIMTRQYEMYIRKMLNDVQYILEVSKRLVEKYKSCLAELHHSAQYKEAIPCDTVFPLFKNIWAVWRDMQNYMHLITTVNHLMQNLTEIQSTSKIPHHITDKMLEGKVVFTDEERMSITLTDVELVSKQRMGSTVFDEGDLRTPMTEDLRISSTALINRHISFLGFCALSLNVGALIPSNKRVGVVKFRGGRYGFCSTTMGTRFCKDPKRHVNEVLHFARNHPHIINLLDILPEVRAVRDIDVLNVEIVPKVKTNEAEAQTLVHPKEEYIEHNYHWDMWEWKRRACQWANITNCQTHGTQTNYSHLRSEIHCQTYSPRDRCEQTMKTSSTNTSDLKYIWGLRGQIGDGQHKVDLTMPHEPEKLAGTKAAICECPKEDTYTSDHSEDLLNYLPMNDIITKEIGDWILKLKEKLE